VIVHRIIFAVGLGFTALTAGAVDTLVELGMFKCPTCNAVNAYHGTIDRAAEAAGLTFVFAPVPEDAHKADKEFMYYGNKAHRDDIRNAFFTAIHTYRVELDSHEDIARYLKYEFPDRDFSMKHADVMQSTRNLSRLLEKSGANAIPTFLVVRGDQVTVLPTAGSAVEIVQQVLTHLNALAK
jgi:hypothetical protein